MSIFSAEKNVREDIRSAAEELLNQVRTEAIDMFYQLTPQKQEAHKAYLKQIQQAKTTQEIRPPRKEIYLMLKANPMNQ